MPEAGGPGGCPITVCLVEDHEQLRTQLVAFLEHAGLRVLAAVGTLAEGRAAILAHHPDVAVIDNRLPDGEGTDLCRALADDAPGVAVLIHTGTLSTDLEAAARAAGAAAVVAKSARGLPLLDAIHSHRQAGTRA